MGVIFDQLRKVDDEARACDGDGSAHLEWKEARQVDRIELASLEAMVATGQIAVGAVFQIGFECGFITALKTPVDKIAPD